MGKYCLQPIRSRELIAKIELIRFLISLGLPRTHVPLCIVAVSDIEDRGCSRFADRLDMSSFALGCLDGDLFSRPFAPRGPIPLMFDACLISEIG